MNKTQEQEALFENRTVLDRKSHYEETKVRYNVINKKLRIFALALAVFCFPLGLWCLLDQNYLWASLLLPTGLLSLYMAFWRYLHYARKEWRDIKASNSPANMDFLFFSQHHDHIGPSMRLSVWYHQVSHIIETETAFILIILDHSVLIRKDGFLKGTHLEFLPFLIENCSNARIRTL